MNIYIAELKQTLENKIRKAQADMEIFRRKVDCQDAYLGGLKEALDMLKLVEHKMAEKAAKL